ncbi:hypothetical protein SAMN02746041_00680 [Desulfacinum hydrothermale DSM 13146]|uniref:Uncharacterized protein n=1 Tax=Desulfacinum hydrothermale DSM 13146 TaxID=1121390 RepID=A0A1W1X6L0_9BACT|nr:hypothetical protein SAMN02746041_00680 [Desulfacinum hydrothermale DSM 13146]
MRTSWRPAARAFCLLGACLFTWIAPWGGSQGTEVFPAGRLGPGVCRAEVIEDEEGITYRTLPQGPPGAQEQKRDEERKIQRSWEVLRHLWLDLNLSPNSGPESGRPEPTPQTP